MTHIKQTSQSQRTRHEKKRTKAGDQSIPPFLAKTYDILQNHDNLISWNEEGNGFVVKNITEFTQQILPRYFKHNNYASFVRQLNMYGFHKVKSTTSDAQVFTHQKFLRNDRDSLKQIKRKVNAESNNDKNQQLRLDLVNNNSSESALIGQIRHLKKKQDQLQKVVDVLAQQNKQILQDNRRLWKRMKKTMERQQKKFQNILLLFLLNGGHNPDDVILDKQQIGGHEEMNHALLPVEEPKRQNIMDALLSRFNNQHKNNYKDQLYLQNNGQHLKLINNMVNHLNQNKEDNNKYMLEYQNELQPESLMSPASFPQSEIPMSPIPAIKLQQDDEDDLIDNLSLQKGISSEYLPFGDQGSHVRSDFLDDK